MLTVHNLSLFKNHKKIFGPIGFSISLGAALIISGKNGSGKTSLLKVLSGISSDYQGEILWGGANIEEFRDDFNGDLQFLGHKNFLKQDLTVLENLRFYAKLSDAEILIPSALKYFDLENLADQKVKKLSAGWQRRVMLAKLICCPATLWFLDEPSNNLDADGKERLGALIESKIKSGQGLVVMTTHDEMFYKLGVRVNIEDFS